MRIRFKWFPLLDSHDDVGECSQCRVATRCNVRISHPSNPEAWFPSAMSLRVNARQVERKIKRTPFSLPSSSSLSSHRGVITLWYVDFIVAARLSQQIARPARLRSRRIKSSFIVSRTPRIARRRIATYKIFRDSLHYSIDAFRERKRAFTIKA